MDVRLAKGTKFTYQGRNLTIMARLSNGELQVQDEITMQFEAMSEQTIVTALFRKELQFHPALDAQKKVTRAIARDLDADLSLFGAKERAEIQRRLAYVRAIVSQVSYKKTKVFIDSIAKGVAKILQEEPPGWVSIYRWLTRYVDSGNDTRALLPALHQRGNRTNKLGMKKRSKVDLLLDQPPNIPQEPAVDPIKADQILTIIQAVVSEKYLSLQRPTGADVYDGVVGRIGEYNAKQLSSADHLPLPSRSSIYQHIYERDPFDVAKARYGEALAKQKWGWFKQGLRPTRPMEIVAIDHTPLDVIAVDAITRLPLGRPTLTVAIDLYTKMVVGLFISYNPASSTSILHCLKNMIEPKDYVKRLYPHIRGEWNVYGKPALLLLDNGDGSRSEDVEDACLQLNIVLDFNRPRTPWHKVAIERWIRTNNEGLLHLLPGTTFSNILKKGEYNSVKQAVIEANVLEELLHIFVISYYHFRPHRSIKALPIQKWNEAIAHSPPVLPRSWRDLNILLGRVETRSLDGNHIQIDNLMYSSEELCLLHRRLGKGVKVRVKIDPFDLSHIFVADPDERSYFEVPALDQEYTKGLTQWQHTVITRYINKRLKETVNPFWLAQAKQQIQEIVEREYYATRKVTGRRAAARYLGEMVLDHKRLNTSEKHLTLPAASTGAYVLPSTTTWDGVSEFGQSGYSLEEPSQPDISESTIITEPPVKPKKPRKLPTAPPPQSPLPLSPGSDNAADEDDWEVIFDE